MQNRRRKQSQIDRMHSSLISEVRLSASLEYMAYHAAPPPEAQPRDVPKQYLDDGLQFPCISERVLNRHLRNLLLIAFLIHTSLQSLIREIYPSVLDQPTSTLRELYDRTLTV
jgi:hypothetical protein